MGRNRVALLAAAVVLTAGVAWAEEIVYFTNGTTMPIRAHEIRAEMIHVDLGGDSFMAFPASMVEKIEQAGSHVLLDPSSMGNQMVNSGQAANSGSRPVRGTVPSRHGDSNGSSESLKSQPVVETDEDMGIAVHRPYAGQGAKARRTTVATPLNSSARGKYRGTRPMGTSNVIGASAGPFGRRTKADVEVMGFSMKTNATPSKPPKPDNNSSSSSGSDPKD